MREKGRVLSCAKNLDFWGAQKSRVFLGALKSRLLAGLESLGCKKWILVGAKKWIFGMREKVDFLGKVDLFGSAKKSMF